MRKDEKLPYDNAELEVVTFDCGDVITTSLVEGPGNWDNVDPDGGDWA